MTLIGATTENPYFEVNSALLSRCQIYELEPLSTRRVAVVVAARRGRARRRRRRRARALDRALAPAATRARALNILELACADAEPRARRSRRGTSRTPRASGRSSTTRARDPHYDFTSAFIKSMRGSDPDAAVYYLAAMLEGGEDPRFIARRMVVLASEDIGNADPQRAARRRRGGAGASSTSACRRRG